MPFKVPEGPYSIDGVMESIRTQVIDPEDEGGAPPQAKTPAAREPAQTADAPLIMGRGETSTSALQTQLDMMRQRMAIEPEYHIHSHRPVLGVLTSLLKKVIYWGVRPYLNLLREKQEEFNESTLNAMREVCFQMEQIQGELAAREERWEQHQRESKERWEQHQREAAELLTQIADFKARIKDSFEASREMMSSIARRHDLRPLFEIMNRETRLQTMDVTRGTFEDITQRQAHYKALFMNRPGRILDLGCGRGELLNMIRIEGFECWGAETDPDMAEAARSRGVHVEQLDALTALASVKPASLGGIFAGQVAEHLFPGELARLIRLARRQLAPGGIIILETVNVSSPAAFAKSFTRDLDHKLPLHPQYLKLLLESAGFANVELHCIAPFAENERPAPLPPAEELGIGAEARAALQERLDFLDQSLFGMQDYYVQAEQAQPLPPDDPTDVPTVTLNL